MKRTGATAMTIADAIRTAREAQRLTQQMLAEMAGFAAAQTISEIERDVREVKAWELVRIAEALRKSPEVLLGLRREPVTKVLWRRGSSKQATRTREAQLLQRSRRYAQLEELCEIPPRRPLPEFALSPDRASQGDALRIADDLRSTLDLGSKPAASIGKVLEECFGVKVFYEALDGNASAACARGDFGAAILMDASEAPWRCNYNFAHELFHLVTWQAVMSELPEDSTEPEWLERVEKLADKFASHLLLPADELLAQYDSRRESRELDHADLVELAREFDVSTAALLWRLVTLSRMSADDVRSLLADEDFRRKDRRSMYGRWPVPTPETLPPRYKRLAVMAYEKGKIGRARLAEYLEVKIGELRLLDLDTDAAPEAAFA